MRKIRKRNIPKNVSNEKIRDYMISNNFVYEATLDGVFKAIMGGCLLYLGDIISKLTGLDKDFIIKNFKEQNVEHKIANALERKKVSDFIFKLPGLIINLECNRGYWDGLIERNDDYFGKLKGELLSKGEEYSKKIKVIQINFDIFNNFEECLGKENISKFYMKNNENIIETKTSEKIHIDMMKSYNKYLKGEELTKLDKELVILMLEDYLEIKKLAEGDEELMEGCALRLYELTDNIDNIGLYDPEKRRKEEEALKIEYHSNIAREQGIEQGIKQGIEQGIKTGASNEKKTIAKNLINIGMPLKDIVKTTGLSKKQITMLM